MGAAVRGAVLDRDDEPADRAARLDAKKKTLNATERDEAARAAWRAQVGPLDPARFVWVDEFGSHLGLTRTYARAPRNRGQNRTTLTSLTLAGLGAGFVVDGGITTRGFAVYVEAILAPTLRPGQVVVMDNLRQHRSPRVRALIEARGAQGWFLPSYSPDLNPIEEAFAKVKTLLRTAAARTEEDLLAAIWAALRAITPADALGYATHCGYPLPLAQAA